MSSFHNSNATRCDNLRAFMRLLYLIFAANGLFSQQRPEAEELTRRLAAHSTLFRTHDKLGKPLTSVSPDKNNIVLFTADFINDYVDPLSNKSAAEQTTDEIAHLVHSSATIVTARALSHRSAFTPSKAFIYSDWDFEVLRVLKNESVEGVQIGSFITVSRPGGSVTLNGTKYIAVDKTFPDYQDGNTYILLLHQLSDMSHSFRVFSGDSFLVSGSKTFRIDDYQRHSALSDRLGSISSEDFANILDNAVRNKE